jgi:hypothetical protein
MRSEISRRLIPARASSRLATLAHAISSTSATTPINTYSGRESRSRAGARPRPAGSTSRRFCSAWLRLLWILIVATVCRVTAPKMGASAARAC